MTDKETTDLLPDFLETARRLGFEEKQKLVRGNDDAVYTKDSWVLYVFPHREIWLLEYRSDGYCLTTNGSFNDGGHLESVVRGWRT